MATKRRQRRAATGTLGEAVQATLDALELQPQDAAAAELARHYARAIDELAPDDVPRLIGTLGPSLLRALEALGATPAARAKVAGTLPTARPVSPLEALRAARRQ